MPDTYATIAAADSGVQERLADVLDLYLADLHLPSRARVLEIGSGTGAVTRLLEELPGVSEVIGTDPSLVLVLRARKRSADDAQISFTQGDGRDLPFENESFDAVVAHTTLCQVPDCERQLSEARRVSAAGGLLAVFDGDYATTTVAVGECDPLQMCAAAAISALVHDRVLVRRLPALVRTAGWEPVRVKRHGYVEATDPSYMPTLVDRGADALVADRRLGAPAAASLKDEARRRATDGRFHGQIAHASVIARKAAVVSGPLEHGTVNAVGSPKRRGGGSHVRRDRAGEDQAGT